jgi:hypothetical protein
MSTLIRTNKLRFIEREGKPDPFYVNAMTGKPHVPTYRVLQQWWEQRHAGNFGCGCVRIEAKGEWHDVPLEEDHDR